MSETEFRELLAEQLDEAFECTDEEIESVVEAADEMRRSISENDGGLGAQGDLSAEKVTENLRKAPDNLSLKVKWNYWAGSIGYHDNAERDFRITEL